MATKFHCNVFHFHRVILRNPYVGKNLITRSQYKQMIGRAGRAGIDTSGESIMLVDKRDKDKVRVNISHAPYGHISWLAKCKEPVHWDTRE